MFGLIEGLIGITIYVIIGIVIGWHLPQPEWAKIALAWLKQKAINAWQAIKTKIKNSE